MNDKEMIENTLINIAENKLQFIKTHITMFQYRWYGKQAPRKYYDELFEQILNIIKVNKGINKDG